MSERSGAGAFQRIARRYLRVAVVYLSLGAVLGALMMWFGNDNFRFLHSHILLVGALLFAAYGAGFLWIAVRAENMPFSGSTTSLVAVQFWLANIGLPGMLLSAVLPVGIGLDRIGVLFGFMEAVAAVMYGMALRRALKTETRGRP